MRKVFAFVTVFALAVAGAASAQVVGNGESPTLAGNGKSATIVGNGCNSTSVAAKCGHPTPTPSPTPTPNVSYQNAVKAIATPLCFLRLNSTTGTEGCIGISTQAFTFVGSGTRGGASLDNDTGSASYSPGGNTANYVLGAAPFANWPASSVQTATFGVLYRINSTDCNSGATLFTTNGPVNGTNTATFTGSIQNDGANSCHWRVTSDDGSNQAITANGSLTIGSLYELAYTFNRSGSPSLNAYACQTTCATQTPNSAVYMFAWTNTGGPIMLGQDSSKTTQNSPAGTGSVSGSIADLVAYTQVATPTQIESLYTAATVATPTPAPTPTPVPTPTPLAYNSTSACIGGKLYTNNVLPSGAGEFGTNGLGTYFAQNSTRTQSPTATWGPYQPSWGVHQFDTTFLHSGDAIGGPFNPFAIVNDTGAAGSPQALAISAEPAPSPIATSLALMANDQYELNTTATSNFNVPAAGGSLVVNVTKPTAAQDGWTVGIGTAGVTPTFIGKLTSGGNVPSTNGGGSNPWTISNVRLYNGTTSGTVITPGSNDDGGFRNYNFPDYVAGALDTNVNQQYGFFVARMRLPAPLPAISPAFWMLETGGVGTNNGQLLRTEWDTEEQFGNDYGYELNGGTIWWNSGNNGSWYSYGCGLGCAANNATQPGATGVYSWPTSGNYNTGYHDYGYLIQPGGLPSPPPTNFSGSAGGVYTSSNPTSGGMTLYVDGQPVPGHIGEPDLTQGSPDKEIMLMFQVYAPGTWIDPSSQGPNNTWPQTMYVQWLRIYAPTASSC